MRPSIYRLRSMGISEMSGKFKGSTEAFRQSLHGLQATGATGFEGLVGRILSAIAGIPFRLASSGPQEGTDGDSALSSDHVSYECKRYGDYLDRHKVLSKLAELSTRQDVDLWVLAGTAPVSAQLGREIGDIGSAQALETLVLDWNSGTGLPLLAVACAMVPDDVLEFLNGCGMDAVSKQSAADGMLQLSQHPRFATHADAITRSLKSAQLGLENLRQRNIGWMRSTLSDRSAAQSAFGQPLAPSATSQTSTLVRPATFARIQAYLRGEDESSPLFIVGSEGVGKSWAVVQAWLSQPDPPALFVLTADAFVSTPLDEAVDVLARTIARQCGVGKRESDTDRWLRKLDRWMDTPHKGVRFVIYMDGINQQQTVDWARLIERIDLRIRGAGGRIIVSSRGAYFNSSVASRLMSGSKHSVLISEWSDDERDAILRQRGLDPRSLADKVLQSLHNPRLLGIALELLDNDTVSSLQELDVGRLLFERLLAANQFESRPTPAHELVRRLGDHARKLIERLGQGELDDLLIFDMLAPVVEEHYFHPLKEDPGRYRLTQDGIRLALALAILDHLQHAMRNGKPLVAAALTLIDPVAALDDSSGVLLASLSISFADDECSDEVRIALLLAYAELQNPGADDLSPFLALAGRRPDAFMRATYDVCLKTDSPPNSGWIKLGAWEAAQSTAGWTAASRHIDRWLRTHSFEPARALAYRHSVDQGQRVEKLREAQGKLDGATSGLLPVERELFERIVQIPEDPATLHRFAFSLLAGRPLSSFVDAFVVFVLGSHLDPKSFPPDEELNWLCWLNTCDWPKMRDLILCWNRRLTEGPSSTTASWICEKLLRVTGDPEDAFHADALRTSITKRTLHSFAPTREWRHLDPSDVDSPEPDDLDDCAHQVFGIPAQKLYLHFGVTSEDYSLKQALPTLARFRPAEAVSKIQEIALDVPSRTGMAFRQGLFAVHKHAAVLSPEHAAMYLELRASEFRRQCEGLSDTQPSVLSSLCLDLAFPHVTGEQQLSALSFQSAIDEASWLRLFSKFKTAEIPRDGIAAALEDAIKADHESTICYLLYFLCSIPMIESLEQTVLDLTGSSSERIRIHAFGLIEECGSHSQLGKIAAGTWTAQGKSHPEAYYGSLVLLRAASEAGADIIDVARRISGDLYGRLAEISPVGAVLCADILDKNIRHAAGVRIEVPAVEIFSEDRPADASTHINVIGRKSSPPGPDLYEALKTSDDLAESEASSKANSEIFQKFSDSLDAQDVSFVLCPLSVSQAAAVLRASPGRIGPWLELLLPKDGRPNALLKNIALSFAAHLSSEDAVLALRLIDGYADLDDIVGRSFGYTRLSMLQRAIWSASTSEDFNERRHKRLALASDDAALAKEVLAAERWGHGQFLDELVHRWLSAPEPAYRARATLIQGFRSSSEAWPAELEPDQMAGLLRQACKTAKDARLRNRNALHWYKQLCQASTGVDFWRFGVLMSNAVDHRADLWLTIPGEATPWISIYFSEVHDVINNVTNNQRSELARKLYGVSKPPESFFARQAGMSRRRSMEGIAL